MLYKNFIERIDQYAKENGLNKDNLVLNICAFNNYTDEEIWSDKIVYMDYDKEFGVLVYMR